MDRHVLLSGLRRSGTTLQYRIFRSHPKVTAFDEPFRPNLRAKLAGAETEDLPDIDQPYARRRREIMDRWSWIPYQNELIDSFAVHQREYIAYLLSQDEHVFIDFTRANCRILDLRQVFHDATVVFQVRDPRAWVTSHARPASKSFDATNGPDYRDAFFEAVWDFGFWGMDRIARNCDLDGPSVVQLLQIWNGVVGAALDQRPDRVIPFEKFALHPLAYLRDMLSDSMIDYELLDWSQVHDPNPPAFLDDDRWGDLINQYIDPKLHHFIHDFQGQTERPAETP